MDAVLRHGCGGLCQPAGGVWSQPEPGQVGVLGPRVERQEEGGPALQVFKEAK